MRRAHLAMKPGNWESVKEEYRQEGEPCEWTFERIREACEKVAMDDIGRLGIAQEILRNCKGFLRRIIAPVDGMERSHFVVCLPALQQLPSWMTTFGGYRRDTETATTERRNIATGGERLVEANTTVRALDIILVVQIGVNANEAKVINARVTQPGCVTTCSMR